MRGAGARREARAASALGFHVRSGCATGVLVNAAPSGAAALWSGEVALSDPRHPETRQPYHADFGELETDQRTIARRLELVHAAVERSLDDLERRLTESGDAVSTAALVVGSLIDPAAVANPHIRAHALEGRLFRTVLAELLAARGYAVSVFLARALWSETAARLGSSEARLKRELAGWPRPAGPWRAAEKLAALAAWQALLSRRPASRGRGPSRR